jgi:hypothetical protein
MRKDVKTIAVEEGPISPTEEAVMMTDPAGTILPNAEIEVLSQIEMYADWTGSSRRNKRICARYD